MKLDNVSTLVSAFFIGLLCLITIGYAEEADDEDIDVHIDFTSGAIIVNEAPTVVKPIDKISIPFGTLDSVFVADLNDVFFDAESGSALEFSATVIDSALLKVGINSSDSVAYLAVNPELEGRTNIIFTASDGTKSVSDTVDVVVKKLFSLGAPLADTIMKSSDSVMIIEKDLSLILPVNTEKEQYSFSITSNEPSFVSVSADTTNRTITMSVAARNFGIAEIELIVEDSDNFIVRDTFIVDVRKRYTLKLYERKSVFLNPGISVYTGIGYSGGFAKLWLRDIFGFALGGYAHWDKDEFGFEGQLLAKPPLNFPVNPFVLLSGGYHNADVRKTDDELMVTTEKNHQLGVFRVAGGADLWVGKTKQHVISFEVGYTHGKKDFESFAVSEIGSSIITKKVSTYKMPPLHLRLSYSFFFMKL